jgi:hypothetical protein
MQNLSPHSKRPKNLSTDTFPDTLIGFEKRMYHRYIRSIHIAMKCISRYIYNTFTQSITDVIHLLGIDTLRYVSWVYLRIHLLDKDLQWYINICIQNHREVLLMVLRFKRQRELLIVGVRMMGVLLLPHIINGNDSAVSL